MRRLTPLIPLLLFAAGCASSKPYTAQDLAQVNQAYTQLLPVYLDFRSAYKHSDFAAMTRDFAREQRICPSFVDPVDRRDTIDPNTNLFQLSADMDNFCNDIESAYAGYRKDHHLPYDKRVNPAIRSEAFHGSDLELKKMRKYVQRPSAIY